MSKEELENDMRELESLISLKEKINLKLKEKQNDVIRHSVMFNSYEEVYIYVKNVSKSLEEFNEAMLFIRPLFLNQST